MTKILFTTPQLEHPPAGGPNLRIENSIKALSRVSELHLISRVHPSNMGGHEAESFYRSLCAGFGYSPSVSGHPFQQDVPALINYAETNGIDIIWFGYGNVSFHLMQAIKTQRPHFKVICDTDSVWSRFVLRELPYEQSPDRRIQIEQEGHQKEREEADWVNFCDVTTAVSEVDAAYYRSLTKEPNRIHIFSNVIDLASYVHHPPPPSDFKKPCLYLAGTFYAPTSPMVRAAQWILSQVLPIIKKVIPDIHFYIIGNGANVYLSDMHSPNITITGKVKSVLPYLCNSDVALVPLMFESGTRFKIMEAGACGIPIVSTTLGAEGIPVTHGKDILLADTPDMFAEAAIRLINDKEYAKEIAKHCRILIEQHYSVESLIQEAKSILKYLGYLSFGS